MTESDGEKPKWQKGNKAQNLLSRFPIIDLAQAVVLKGSNRQAFLKRFADTRTTKSYAPTREAASMIYASQKPMFETPAPDWNDIEKFINKAAHREILEMNLDASRSLFDFIRGKDYQATDCEPEVLRVRLKNVVSIKLSFYVTDGDRLLFQFPLLRRTALTNDAIEVLGSIIHHAYAQGDFKDAEVEVADISCLTGEKERSPRIRRVARTDVLDREALTEQIDDVYEILRSLAMRPPPDKGGGDDGFFEG